MKKNSDALHEGARIQNRYVVRELLGAGGFGITYRAYDTMLRIDVAIKEFFPRVVRYAKRDTRRENITPLTGKGTDYRDALELFLGEARTLALFRDHAFIVTIHDIFEEKDTYYMVMDFHEGGTLFDLIKREKRQQNWEANANGKRNCLMSRETAIQYIIPVLDALRALHQHEPQILHRDIKPSNVLLDGGSRPVLIDFGEARQVMGEHSQSLEEVVSHGYSPFELYQSGTKKGPETDLYSVGATLYHMVTGELPPRAPDRYGKRAEKLVPPHEKVAGISREFSNIIMGLLQPDSVDRHPQTVTVLQHMLLQTDTAPAPRPNGSSMPVEPRTGDDLSITLSITHEQRLQGITTPLLVTKKVPCSVCQGAGVTPVFCNECDGQGRVDGEEKISVTVPPGWSWRKPIVVKNKGDAGIRRGVAGDLQVNIKRAGARSWWKRRGVQVGGLGLLLVLLLASAFFVIGPMADRCSSIPSEPREAIVCYEERIAENPQDLAALNNLGKLYFNEEDYEKSEKTFLRLIALNPDENMYIDALFFAARAHYWQHPTLTEEHKENLRRYIRCTGCSHRAWAQQILDRVEAQSL